MRNPESYLVLPVTIQMPSPGGVSAVFHSRDLDRPSHTKFGSFSVASSQVRTGNQYQLIRKPHHCLVGLGISIKTGVSGRLSAMPIGLIIIAVKDGSVSRATGGG